MLAHICFRGKFPGGVPLTRDFERKGESIKLQVGGPLVVGLGSAVDLAVDAAVMEPG